MYSLGIFKLLTGNWDRPTPTGMTPQVQKLSKVSVSISFSIINGVEVDVGGNYIENTWEFNICAPLTNRVTQTKRKSDLVTIVV